MKGCYRWNVLINVKFSSNLENHLFRETNLNMLDGNLFFRLSKFTNMYLHRKNKAWKNIYISRGRNGKIFIARNERIERLFSNKISSYSTLTNHFSYYRRFNIPSRRAIVIGFGLSIGERRQREDQPR